MDVITKHQKIIKVGNSYAVTIDKQFVQRYFPHGSEVEVQMNLENGEVFFRPATKKNGKTLIQSISPELQEWTQKFLIENGEALKKLAHL